MRLVSEEAACICLLSPPKVGKMWGGGAVLGKGLCDVVPTSTHSP